MTGARGRIARWLTPSTDRGRFILAAVSLVFCGMFWSSNVVLVRALREDVPPIGFAAARWLLAVLVLLPIAWPALRKDAALIRAHWKALVAAGVVGVALFTMILFIGIQHTVAINGGLMTATQALWVGLVAWAVVGERLNRWQWIGIAVAFMGAAVIVTQGHLAELESVDFRLGDFLYIAALIVWGFYSIIIQKLPRAFHVRTVLFVTAASGTLAMLPFWIGESLMVRSVPVTWEVGAALVYGALIAAIGAFALWNIGVGLIGASAASFFMYFNPIYTAFFAVTLLGEHLEDYHFAGAAFIVAGVVASTRGARVRRRAAD